jgi:hypothetical protein
MRNQIPWTLPEDRDVSDDIAERLKALADLGGMSTEDVRVLREAAKLLAEREGREDRPEPAGEMSALERLGATVDTLGTYRRGVNVGHAQAVEKVINWMVTHGYPVGEDDSLNTLLFELERMAREAPSPDNLSDIGRKK